MHDVMALWEPIIITLCQIIIIRLYIIIKLIINTEEPILSRLYIAMLAPVTPVQVQTPVPVDKNCCLQDRHSHQ